MRSLKTMKSSSIVEYKVSYWFSLMLLLQFMVPMSSHLPLKWLWKQLFNFIKYCNKNIFKGEQSRWHAIGNPHDSHLKQSSNMAKRSTRNDPMSNFEFKKSSLLTPVTPSPHSLGMNRWSNPKIIVTYFMCTPMLIASTMFLTNVPVIAFFGIWLFDPSPRGGAKKWYWAQYSKCGTFIQCHKIFRLVHNTSTNVAQNPICHFFAWCDICVYWTCSCNSALSHSQSPLTWCLLGMN